MPMDRYLNMMNPIWRLKETKTKKKLARKILILPFFILPWILLLEYNFYSMQASYKTFGNTASTTEHPQPLPFLLKNREYIPV